MRELPFSQDAVHNEIIRFYHYAKLTRPWKSDPLNSHLYIVKFGFTRESTIFICLVLFKHRLWVLVKNRIIFAFAKIKDTDQLHGNHTGNQCLCFRNNSAIPLLFQASSDLYCLFCVGPGRTLRGQVFA